MQSTLAAERESTVIQCEGRWYAGRGGAEKRGREERRQGDNGKRDRIEGGAERIKEETRWGDKKRRGEGAGGEETREEKRRNKHMKGVEGRKKRNG